MMAEIAISELIEDAVPELRGNMNRHRDFNKDGLSEIYRGKIAGFTRVGDVPDHHNSTAVIRHEATGRMFTMVYSSGCSSFDWWCKLGHEVAPDTGTCLDNLRVLEAQVKAIVDRINTPMSGGKG